MARKRGPKVIEAEEFRLVDAEGQLWAMLHARDGDPTLELRDEQRRTGLTLKIENGRPLINLEYGGELGVVGLGVSEEGDIGIQVSATDGKMRFMLQVSRDGDAKMMLLDRNAESVVWRAP